MADRTVPGIGVGFNVQHFLTHGGGYEVGQDRVAHERVEWFSGEF